jgi:lipid A 4'-phosphatase
MICTLIFSNGGEMRSSYFYCAAICLIIVVVIFTPIIDLKISRFFFMSLWGNKGEFVNNSLTSFFYHFGVIPALFVVILSFFIFIFSFFISSLSFLRSASLMLILTLILGSGCIVNMVLKEYWGRARPVQISEFGGKHLFTPCYKANFGKKEESLRAFPSGHATMGFFFISFIRLGNRLKNLLLKRVGVISTFFLGIGISVSRMAQGAHFFSDILFSLIIMYLTVIFTDWLCFEKKVCGVNECLESKTGV